MEKKNDIETKNVIIKTSADVFMPFALVLGLYVILHGHLSPGGGFQGGVIIAAATLMLYLSYGFKVAKNAMKPKILSKCEAIAAVMYVGLAIAGVFAGAVFCQNIFFDNGKIGDLISAGNINFMNYAVGIKVLTGISFLLLLLLSLLSPENEMEH